MRIVKGTRARVVGAEGALQGLIPLASAVGRSTATGDNPAKEMQAAPSRPQQFLARRARLERRFAAGQKPKLGQVES